MQHVAKLCTVAEGWCFCGDVRAVSRCKEAVMGIMGEMVRQVGSSEQVPEEERRSEYDQLWCNSPVLVFLQCSERNLLAGEQWKVK